MHLLPSAIARTEKFLIGLVFAVVIAAPLFYFSHAAYPYLLPKTLVLQALVEILFCLWVVCAIFDPRVRPKKSLLLSATLVFFAALFITGFTGEDPLRSMWGLEERMLGVIGFLHFGMLFVVLQSMGSLIPWKKIWYASFDAAVLASIVALIQLVHPNILLEEQVGVRPGSFFGNPTFLAIYLLLHIFIGIFWIADALRRARMTKRYGGVWMLFSATLVIAIALFVTQTRGDIAGLGLGVLILLLLNVFHPPENLPAILGKRSFYAGILLVLFLFGGIFLLTRDAPLWSHVPGLRRLGSVSLSDELLLPRLTALRVAWAGFVERPLIGWGWDNFNLYFDAHYDPRLLSFGYQETRFDKPHNIFLEYLFSGGVILFGAFVFLVIAFFLTMVRIRDRILRYALIAALVAYLARSLFIFDTLSSLLVLFLIAAYADAMVSRDASPPAAAFSVTHKTSLRNRWASGAVGIAIVAVFFPFYFLNIRSFEAAYHQYEGFVHTRAGDVVSARADFASLLRIGTPWAPSMVRDYTQLTVGSYFLQGACVPPACVTPDDVRNALTALEAVSRAHPKDAYYHYALLDLYNEAFRLDPKTYSARAEEEAHLALLASPSRQQIYFSLAKTKLNEGKRTETLALLVQGIALSPEVPDGHFYYGITLFDAGDGAHGYVEILKAVALGKQWASPDEPRIAADFFVDAGHVKDAVSLYEAALVIDPQNLNAKIGIAIALFRLDDRERARGYLEDIVRTTNVTKLSAYARLAPALRALRVAF